MPGVAGQIHTVPEISLGTYSQNGSLAEGSSFFAVRKNIQFRQWGFSFYKVLIHVQTFIAAYS